MSDIVERLQDVAAIIQKEYGRVAGAACLSEEAADTITALRAELERKDAALRVLSDHFIHGYGDNTRGGVIRAVENIARAALSAQKEEEA